MRKNLIFTILLAIFCLPMFANNITVGTPTLTDENVTNGFVNVKFNLTWDNSWRLSSGATNWDAAWVFVGRCWGMAACPFEQHGPHSRHGHGCRNHGGFVGRQCGV